MKIQTFVTTHRWHKYLLPTYMFDNFRKEPVYRWFNWAIILGGGDDV